MDKKSKILILVFLLLIVASVAVTYYRIFIKRDYIISAEMDCDPLEENCYLWICDPAVDGEGYCTGDPEEDTWYYKILNRKAYNIPMCDPSDEECEALMCPEGEADCEILNCEEGEEDCVTSEQYLIENPDALEEECEEDDEECLLEEGDETECEEGDEECLMSQEEGAEEEEMTEEGELIEENTASEEESEETSSEESVDSAVMFPLVSE